ncbi:hypothetical protein FB45DRAFT_1040218 [Roridomyces roridus]|uniref:Uncharacterized protein n=1 Tax=Roridomyces roridus TaxID=1738132 RepID=A0AAD7B1W5_9AGAR|nr:hypothetical protein FB45DRAFT_1040218 [Roridomyces roridus]
MAKSIEIVMSSRGKWYILCAVSVRLIASYIAILLAVSTFIAAKETPEISSAKHRDTSTKPQLVIAYVPLLLTAEVFLTFTTAYFLLKSRQAVPYSAGLLKALTVLAFQTAAPPALCALLIFLLSVSFPDGHRPRVTAPVASNTILPKVRFG